MISLIVQYILSFFASSWNLSTSLLESLDSVRVITSTHWCLILFFHRIASFSVKLLLSMINARLIFLIIIRILVIILLLEFKTISFLSFISLFKLVIVISKFIWRYWRMRSHWKYPKWLLMLYWILSVLVVSVIILIISSFFDPSLIHYDVVSGDVLGIHLLQLVKLVFDVIDFLVNGIIIWDIILRIGIIIREVMILFCWDSTRFWSYGSFAHL